ncbi:3'(2'),5'-bisphosphate nucleotidase CysQ [uncultured Jannaschia sp.]|uniref:3'(2'),5'-bisphosphate nucleotidase CysQ n=1 Tax=uncultured Jannaschia sp. TaxID=293347 RepID=UPI002618292C|nr:3'(2'),5'-bisphosphate nucleotidase CysQ [uncultured Jannaschia sp.]
MPASDRAAPDDAALLEEAARAAGAIARRHFGTGPECWDKGEGQGPVTEADLEIDAMLRDMLTAARPDYGWLSEESPDGPERLERRRVFVVDPIDGTRAFIAGETSFSHALAVVEDGVPHAAAIHLPLKDRMYVAARGHGATRNGCTIAPSGRDGWDGARVLGAKANFHPDRWRAGRPPVKAGFVPSLAYRLALVAEGRFDAMLTLRPSWEWDIASGALIVAEAGGTVHDRRGAALRFNNAHPQVDGVVAGTPSVQAAMIAGLA